MGKLNKYLFLDIDGVICTRRSLYRTMANFFDEEFNEYYWKDPKFKDLRDNQRQDIIDSANEYRQRYKEGKEDTPVPSWSMDNFPMDYIAMDNLNKIVEETGCKVVLSSSWRWGDEDCSSTQRKLAENGFDHELIDRTPVDGKITGRGNEIQWWLDNKAEEPYHYVIIDDDWQDVYGWHPNNLVVTNFDTGLGDAETNLALQILRDGSIDHE